MFKKSSIPMFFILLAPLYFSILVCLVGMSTGSIEWLYFAASSALILVAAWALSRRNSLPVNALGLLIFAGMGIYLITSTLARAVRMGPWTLNIFTGAALTAWGLGAFIYDIVKHMGITGREARD